MDLNQIEAALQEIVKTYADRRLNVFEVAVDELVEGALRLRGRVMEESNLQTLVQNLAQRFPGLRVDAQAVMVARQSPPRLRSVATNLTSMHDGTSFLAEMSTQMLNGMTVELLWEEKNWGFARQLDGYLGWTYLPYLTVTPPPQPTHLVMEPVGLLRAAPNAGAELVTRVLGGTEVHVREEVIAPWHESGGDSAAGWAWVELAGGAQGWLPEDNLRALAALPAQPETRRAHLAADAFRMIGVPYLWGGCSANGIDCSGFAQLLHRWIGIRLPRDADMQCVAGKAVEPPFEVGDLLFFGEKGAQRRITHVGISLGGWRIIHSSRRRNGVQVDDVQAVDGLRESYLCAATYIRG